MSHVLTEVVNFDTNITVPDDGDLETSASIVVSLQSLANRSQLLLSRLSNSSTYQVGPGGFFCVDGTGLQTFVVAPGGSTFLNPLLITNIGGVGTGSLTTAAGAPSTFNGTITCKNSVSLTSGASFSTASGVVTTFNGNITGGASCTATWAGSHVFNGAMAFNAIVAFNNSAPSFNAGLTTASNTSAAIGGTATIAGLTTCNGGLVVSGAATTHNSDVTCNGALNSAGNFSCTGPASFSAGVFISGGVSLTGAGNISIRRTFGAAGTNVVNVGSIDELCFYTIALAANAVVNLTHIGMRDGSRIRVSSVGVTGGFQINVYDNATSGTAIAALSTNASIGVCYAAEFTYSTANSAWIRSI